MTASQSIFDVRHQPLAQGLLQRALSSGRTPHAYVFDGPEGVGKKTLALRFARVLLCDAPRPAADPPEEYAAEAGGWLDGCGTCSNCALLASDSHPDCHLIYRQLSKFHDDAEVRQRKSTELGIPVIRQFVVEAAARKGSAQARKVFVLEEAERMNVAAQNCLLKTLEEPPPETYFVLLATRLDPLLPTTRSRCQPVPFRPLPAAFVAARLAALCPDLEPDATEFLARHEPGSLGLAVRLAEDGYLACNSAVVEDLLDLQRARALELAKRIDGHATELGKRLKSREPESTDSDVHRRALGTVLGLVATFYRDVLRLACGDPQGICNRQAAPALTERARRWGPQRAAEAIAHVGTAQRDAGLNANGLLCLERLMIDLARLTAD